MVSTRNSAESTYSEKDNCDPKNQKRRQTYRDVTSELLMIRKKRKKVANDLLRSKQVPNSTCSVASPSQVVNVMKREEEQKRASTSYKTIQRRQQRQVPTTTNQDSTTTNKGCFNVLFLAMRYLMPFYVKEFWPRAGNVSNIKD
jgi:hypothetical protein